MIDLNKVWFTEIPGTTPNMSVMTCELIIGAELAFDLMERERHPKEFDEHIKRRLVEKIHWKLYEEILTAQKEISKAAFGLVSSIKVLCTMDEVKEVESKIQELRTLIIKSMPDIETIRSKSVRFEKKRKDYVKE